MNPKSTWLWLLIVGGLFGVILLREHFAPKPQVGPRKLLPEFDPAAATTVQVQPAGKPAIIAVRTNGTWRLTEPLSYPSEAGVIDRLLDTLQNLTVGIRISPGENGAKSSGEFGFDPPQATLRIEQSNGPVRLLIGSKTAPGNQVFVQAVGAEGIYVMDADLLNWIPRDANDWRETKLVDLSQIKFDRLDVTNAGKILELQRAPTNQIWRKTMPSEARADNAKIEDSLRELNALRVRQFISDDPKADMESYGLQNPDLIIAFKSDTNTTLLLEFGRSPTNQPDLAYARVDGQKTVVTVPKILFQSWLALHSQDFSDFDDKHLVTFSTPLNAIEIHSTNDDFTLQRTNEAWRVLPQDFPGDNDVIGLFLDCLRNMQASRIEKSVVAPLSLGEFGLASPAVQLKFKNFATNSQGAVSNVSIAELDFGIKETNIYASRVGEPVTVVYAVAWTNFERLPLKSLAFRERRIWKFTADDVARIAARRNGNSLEVLHLKTNTWILASGSQGIINPLGLEEVATRLGELSAAYWVQSGDTNRERFGFAPENYQISVELKDRRKLTVDFGGAAPSGFPYAMTTLEETPWIFEFPWDLWQYLDLYLNPSRQTTSLNSPNGSTQ